MKVGTTCKQNFILSLIFVSFIAVMPDFCSAVDSWPGSAGTVVATLSDASGVVWHEERRSLFVVQNSGRLNEIDESGALLNYWDIAGDLEGITLADNDRYIYIGIEDPDSIVEFDLNLGALTGKTWYLTPWMTGPDNLGLEGLAYRNGYFYAGLQNDGMIYVFDVNLQVNGELSYLGVISPFPSHTDISGIEYNTDTGVTYSIFDTDNALVELNSSNQIVKQYSLPGSAQEGITVRTNCLARTADVYIANDDNGQVIKYASYPVTCLDADSDGVTYSTDCNDYDASISANQTYYRDADSDGQGDSNTTTSVCSLSAPEGYVSNSSDAVDLTANGRLMYINGNNHTFFTVDPTNIQSANLNFYGDDFEEVIAVALTRKRAYVTVARVRGSGVTIVKRVMIKKKYKTAQIITQPTKRKFITKFNGKKKYIWKIGSSGSFSRSR